VPCEGTGSELGVKNLVKGARNADNTRKFYEWQLTERVSEQEMVRPKSQTGQPLLKADP